MPTTPTRRGPGCSTSRAARAWPRCVRRAPPSRDWWRISPPVAGSTSAPRPPRRQARGGSGSAEGVWSPRTTTPVPYRCSERARWGSAHPVPPGDTVAVHASERLVRARALGRQPALGQGLRPLDDRLEVLPRTEDRGVGGRDRDRLAGVGVARDAGGTGPLLEDPSIVSNARKLDRISYNDICNLAYQGAKVLHPRAVEIAMQANIPIRVRSTLLKDEGTLITDQIEKNNERNVYDSVLTGIAYVNHLTQVKIENVEETQQLHAKVFKAMAEAGISVDFINISPNDVVYTIFEQYKSIANEILENLKLQPTFTGDCAKISLVGAGMSGMPGVTSKIVQTLTTLQIPILQTVDSTRTIWVLIENKHLEVALKALHVTFDLEK